jgi:hypothetical protein
MKMYEIVAFNDFYINHISQQQISISVAYKVNKIMQAIKTDLEFYQSELQKIFDDCVEQENGLYKRTEDQKNFIIKADSIEEFEQRYTDLQQFEVTFDDDLKLDVEAFEGLEVSPQEILNITNFLK